jgi:flagellar protein FliS
MFATRTSSSVYVQTPKNMSGAYRQIGLETGVSGASPHHLIVMLFDGALEAIAQARGAIRDKQVDLKVKAITKALGIVDEGLKASLDLRSGGEIAVNLSNVYAYISTRLVYANLRNDDAALEECAKLLSPLREAWVGIAPSQSVAAPSSLELHA